MLEQAAATRWGVAVAEVRAENHKVVHLGSGNMLGYGELARAASALPTPSADGLKLKDPRNFRYIGTGSIPIVDLHDITTGKATYGIDAKIPGMKFAVIARPPVVGGKLVSFDATEALKVPGVEKVVEVRAWPWPSKFMPVGGVAVIARNTGCAIIGRDKLKVVWDNGPNAGYDSVAFRRQMEQTAANACKSRSQRRRRRGRAEVGGEGGHRTVLCAASGACQHGAANSRGECLPGQGGNPMRGLRTDAKSGWLSR
jgi:isoquinoline 1-oxidoreductase beta subunit